MKFNVQRDENLSLYLNICVGVTRLSIMFELPKGEGGGETVISPISIEADWTSYPELQVYCFPNIPKENT